MATAASIGDRSVRPSPALWGLGALVLALSLRLTPVGANSAVSTFVLIFTSIALEALPFILLGAVVAAAIEVFVPQRWFTKLARLPVALQLPGAALGGLAFPVCECGSVPVARRLLARGMHPAAAITFMLAAPVLNPVVLLSTWIAYRGRVIGAEMVWGRAALGLLVAMLVGWALGTEGSDDLLRHSPDEDKVGPSAGRGENFLAHLNHEFLFMGKFLAIGAAAAAALQTLVPQSIVAGVARSPLIGTLALMGMGFVLSLCSEADAFVAVSFTQFPIGSQLAFLVLGPMADTKLAFLYSASFKRRFVLRLLAVAVPLVLAGSLWFEALVT